MPDVHGRESAIDLLIAQEQLAGNLYRRCSKRFPELGDMWRTLIASEDSHVRLLEEIAADREQAAGFCERRQLAVNPLRILLGQVRRAVDALDAPGTSLGAALEVARDLENTVIERSVLDPVTGDPPAVRERILRMSAETAEHRTLVQQAIARLETP